METNNNRKIPRAAWVVGGILGIIIFAYFGFYLAEYYARPSNVPANEPTETITQAVGEDKNEVLAWYKDAIATMEERVDEMEKLTIESSGNLRETYQQHLLAMEEELDTLRQQMKQVRTATDDEWENMRGRIEETRMRVKAQLENDYKDYSVDASDSY